MYVDNGAEYEGGRRYRMTGKLSYMAAKFAFETVLSMAEPGGIILLYYLDLKDDVRLLSYDTLECGILRLKWKNFRSVWLAERTDSCQCLWQKQLRGEHINVDLIISKTMF